jgi:Fic-DOC domain mobile mystery protein B
MKFEYAPGATPLDPDDISGLMPLHITTQNQLNEWENANILKAENWLFSTSPSHNDFLTIDFIKLLHKKMFDDTWKWAGQFRQTEKNIGTAHFQIPLELKNLLDDVVFQITNKSYSIDEIAYRLHHRLVAIHPFPNGNGRHARLFADLFLTKAGQPRFTWGRNNLAIESLTRKNYIHALRAADKHDYTLLAKFVRS